MQNFEEAQTLEITYDAKERGMMLREIRKKKGKRMEDFEDANISRGTIGNIENGKKHVTEQKVKYYCKKLGIDYKALPKLIQQRRQQLDEYHDKILSDLNKIELVIDSLKDNTGLKMLKKMKAPPQLSSVVDFLKGKTYIYLNEPDKAEKYLKRVIKAVNRNVDNVIACAYNELGKIRYYQNHLVEAVQYTDQGLESFQAKEGRKFIYYTLLSNKILYLDKLGRSIEAEELCQKVWKERDKIDHMSVLLNLYDLRGNFLQKRRKYDEAIKLISEALELARTNQQNYRAVELLITLGSIYMEKNEFENAEHCLKIALKLKNKLKNAYLFTTVYVKMGELYMQQGKLDEAKKTLQHAIKNKGRKANISKFVKALTFFGDCNALQNNTEEAIKYYLNALNLAKHHMLQKQELEILKRLGVAYLKTKKKEEYHQTLDSFFRLHVQLNEKEGGVFMRHGDQPD